MIRDVALHEFRRMAGGVTKKQLAIAAVVIVAATLAWPLIRERGVHPERDLFLVGYEEGSPWVAAAEADGRFQLRTTAWADLYAGNVDLWLDDDYHFDPDSARSRAALSAFDDAVQAWLDGEMRKEVDQAAAHPIQVDLLETVPDVLAPAPAPTPGSNQPRPTSLVDVIPDEPIQSSVPPADVEPPFPAQSLLTTFAFLIPMNFVGQFTGGTLLTDRIRHRTTLLLTTPHAGGRILMGRIIPATSAALAVWVGAALVVGTGWVGWIAALPIALFPVAASAVLGLAARSERELTFLTTAVSTGLAAFLFLPALFSALPPVAALSPVSLIAASRDGAPTPLGNVLLGTLPLTLLTASLFRLAAAMHHEEILQSSAGPLRRIVLGLSRIVKGWSRLLGAGVLVVPFCFIAEFFLIALVIPLGLRAAFPIFIAGVAAIEELAKLAVSRAWARRGGRHPALAGLVVGSGFWIGEKLALLVALVGLADVPLGSETLSVLGAESSLLLLVFPLLLHAVAAATSSWLASKRWTAFGWSAALAIHVAYNVIVLVVRA